MSSSSEESDDDNELLTAASAWASSTAQDVDHDFVDDDAPSSKKRKTNEIGDAAAKNIASDVTNRSSLSQSIYSLHLKNVPYDASQGDVRFAFGEKGCNVTSVRLVYDRDQSTGERNFRGVVFIDFADEKSYNLGLKEFHNKSFLGKGRRISVRPTRTKSELSDIVRRTEEKVATLIARSKEVAQIKRDHTDDTLKSDDKNVQSGHVKKKQKRHKEKESTGEVKGGGSDFAKHEGNPSTPEKKKRNKRAERRIAKKSKTKVEKIVNTDPESNDTHETIERSEKKIHRPANSKEEPKIDNKSGAPTTVPQKNEKKHVPKDKEMQTKKRNEKSKSTNRKSDSSINTDQSLKTPQINDEQHKAKEPESGKHKSKSKEVKGVVKDTNGSPVKLTKKQRAKKAAVIRMMKFKS
jgi:hypothetical protein